MVECLGCHVASKVGLMDSVGEALKISFAVGKLLLPKLVLRKEVDISIARCAHILDNLDLHKLLFAAQTALFGKKSISSASGKSYS